MTRSTDPGALALTLTAWPCGRGADLRHCGSLATLPKVLTVDFLPIRLPIGLWRGTPRLPYLLQIEDNGVVTGIRLGLILEGIHLHITCKLGQRVRIEIGRDPPSHRGPQL